MSFSSQSWLEDYEIIVVDNGTHYIRAGISEMDTPTCIVPNIDEVTKQRPVQQGNIVNFDIMDKIWTKLFDDEVHLTPSYFPLYLTYPPLCPLRSLEFETELMFEKFAAKSLYLTETTLPSLTALGRTDGLVLNAGYDRTTAGVYLEGASHPHTFCVSKVGGKSIDETLAKLIKQNSNHLNNILATDICEDIKEKHCSIRQGNEIPSSQTYVLPDGNKITLKSERQLATEQLFTRSDKFSSLVELIEVASSRVPVGSRGYIVDNICMVGGYCSLPGFKRRIDSTIRKEIISNNTYHTILDTGQSPKYSTWIGCSILASLSVNRQRFVSQQLYEEYGLSVVRQYFR